MRELKLFLSIHLSRPSPSFFFALVRIAFTFSPLCYCRLPPSWIHFFFLNSDLYLNISCGAFWTSAPLYVNFETLSTSLKIKSVAFLNRTIVLVASQAKHVLPIKTTGSFGGVSLTFQSLVKLHPCTHLLSLPLEMPDFIHHLPYLPSPLCSISPCI